jgi:hypothetical protein
MRAVDIEWLLDPFRQSTLLSSWQIEPYGLVDVIHTLVIPR